jgi:anti-anti-sigma regulatory factor
MIARKRSVRVFQVPEQLTTREKRIFLQELQNHSEVGRPQVVLNCSAISQMTRAKVHMLLCCLEEALKYNGDVRLASLQPEAEAALRIYGLTRLFEIFTSAEAAVQSFHQRTTSLALTLETEADSEQAA